MDESLDENLTVTYRRGGIIEFQQTGVYPEKLIIRSLKHEHVWRIKVRKDIQIGTLSIKRVPIYHYKFDGTSFNFQKLKKGIAVSDWIPVESMIIEMVD
jgi:hypothetical protein